MVCLLSMSDWHEHAPKKRETPAKKHTHRFVIEVLIETDGGESTWHRSNWLTESQARAAEREYRNMGRQVVVKDTGRTTAKED